MFVAVALCAWQDSDVATGWLKLAELLKQADCKLLQVRLSGSLLQASAALDRVGDASVEHSAFAIFTHLPVFIVQFGTVWFQGVFRSPQIQRRQGRSQSESDVHTQAHAHANYEQSGGFPIGRPKSRRVLQLWHRQAGKAMSYACNRTAGRYMMCVAAAWIMLKLEHVVGRRWFEARRRPYFQTKR